MMVYRDIALARAAVRSSTRRAAVVGYFDGLHIGHQKLLGELKAWAAGTGAEPAVVTFDRHPQEVITGTAPLRILSLEHRLLLFERQGIAVTLVLPFNRDIMGWPAEEFAARVLIEALGARLLLMGFDSAFGHRRQGTFAYMNARAPALGMEVRQAGIQALDGVRVSSTLVRQAILAGDLQRLERLLGRRFSLLGRVVAGDGRGRAIGIPTANLDVDGEVLPPAGVYFADATRRTNGETRATVVNIGRRPTFKDAGAVTVEAHLLDFQGDLYGEEIELHFMARHRDERKFPSVEALVAQIRADIDACRRSTWTFKR